jgi:hypothetical protein
MGATLSRLEPFPLKYQGTVSGQLLAEWFPRDWLGLGVSAGTHLAAASDLSAGFYYRGHWGLDLRPYALFRWSAGASAGSPEILLGGALGPVVRYDRYLLTYRYLFYLGAALAPFVELHDSTARHSVVVAVPIDYFFRRDLSVSVAGAVRVSWKIYLSPPAGPRR